MKPLTAFIVFVLLNSLIVSAQSPKKISQPLTPLEQILNPDGTVKTNANFHGSLDPKGYRMVSQKNGQPRFVKTNNTASDPEDIYWDNQFALPGLDWGVKAIAVSGTDVYVGGYFSTAGGVSANHIAKWNGSSWSALGSGVDGHVNDIEVSGTDVYVGGYFSTAGGVSANHIAKWNGSSWSALGSGVDGSVNDIEVSGTDVYVGGGFDTAGAVSANHIAKWDGSSWSALGSVTAGDVQSIKVSGTNVYVGGFFQMAGGVSANNIAKWNGSSWSALGSGVGNSIYAIAVSGTDVYVGGYFTSAGGVSANHIAKWNGSSWSVLGSGTNGLVNSIAVSETDVYVGGYFTSAGGVSANHIAKWNGSSWSALGSGTDDFVQSIAVSGTDVYVGGWLSTAGGVSANRIAKWNGSSWSALHNINAYGINHDVQAVAIIGTDVYVGGDFTSAGDVSTNAIAKWNGNSWSTFGSGVDGYINAIEVYGTDVYVGGFFQTAGGVSANSIAKWNGTSWSALGSGVDGSIWSIAVSGTDVYVGGFFQTAGGVSANNIAKWNGSSWSALGSGTDVDVLDIAVSGPDVYVGGWFETVGGLSINFIAKWNGSNWSALGSGVSGYVNDIEVSGTDVYVGGRFETAGGVSANKIAKWNGSSWSALGNGVDVDIWSIAVSGTDVYVGGGFSAAGGVNANHIAKWNGSSWSALGSGTNGSVMAIAVSGTDVYLGGNFTTAGGKSSSKIARWLKHPLIDISPIAIGFGDVIVGFSKQDSIKIFNGGSIPLIIDSAKSSNPEFTVTPSSASIAPNDSQQFYITFTPATSGLKIGSIKFYHNAGPPSSITVSNQEIVTLSQSVNQRWNIISASLIFSEYKKTTLYPTALSPAWSYQGAYTQKDTLQNGEGYWLKFNSAQSISVSGVSISVDTIDVSAGWNLVGSISYPVLANAVNGIGTTIQSAFYGYENGYHQADTIKAGKGYWVKVSPQGKLILDSASVTMAKSAVSQNAFGTLNCLTFTDAHGMSQSLYFGGRPDKSFSVDRYDLPPLPPVGIFDVRFESQRSVETVEGKNSKGLAILIQSASYPLTITWEIKEQGISSSLNVGETQKPLLSNGGIQIDNPASKIFLQLHGLNEIPLEYALLQNYPNPFNPATVIKYQLPGDSKVTLKIYNLLGQVIATLSNEIQDAGYKSAAWNASNFASGIYFYRLEAADINNPANSLVQVKKMLLLK